MKCANCGTESDGRFCPSCGSSLEPGRCPECRANLVPGARFCTQCGAVVRAGAKDRGGNPNLPWYIAGGVLLLLVVILLVPMLMDGDAGTAQAPFAPAGATGTPPPLTGTPRENADRLFERVMTAHERGDTAEALRFAPMAVQAYDMAAPLDDDGLFHLATIHVVAGNYDAARTTAERILTGSPDHLLGLAVAGEAAELANDAAAARSYYRRFLDAYDSEMARGLPEYQNHARTLPELRQAAERVTGG
ncbi:MAG TPA: zinc-ribbon domain-containing protein [Longimicrobiales bacterium]